MQVEDTKHEGQDDRYASHAFLHDRSHPQASEPELGLAAYSTQESKTLLTPEMSRALESLSESLLQSNGNDALTDLDIAHILGISASPDNQKGI